MISQNLSLILISLVAVVLPGYLIWARRLSILRDYFYFVVYGQSIIYLNLAPTLWATNPHLFHVHGYFALEIYCFILFQAPFTLAYIFIRNRKTAHVVHGEYYHLYVSNIKLFLLSFVLFVFSLFFLIIVVKYNMFYNRIGYVGQAASIANLGLLPWAIFKSFGLGAALLIALALSAYFMQPRVERKRLILFIILFSMTIQLLQSIVNSRLTPVMDIALYTGIYLYFNPQSSYKALRRLVFLFLAMILIYRMSMNFRFHYNPAAGFSLSLLNPFQSWQIVGGQLQETNVFMRLNGIDLMARMTPALHTYGYAWGKAWKYPALMLYYNLSLQHDRAGQLLSYYLTTAKRYLMLHYTNLRYLDYSSCMLTDMYGNFGPFGFLAAGLILAWMCSFVTSAFHNKSSIVAIVIAILLVQQFVIFEGEFFMVLFGWLRYLPLLILMFWVCPIVQFKSQWRSILQDIPLPSIRC